MGNIWLLALGLLILSYSLAHFYRLVAIALQIIDEPNHRSAHAMPTPTGAGIAFVLVFFLGVWLLLLSGPSTDETDLVVALTPALILITIVGFIDDFKPLPWAVRLTVHLLCAVWVVSFVGFPPLTILDVQLDFGVAASIFGVVSLVWLLNLYNFMDGIDGIAISEAIFAFGAATLIAGIATGASSKVVIVLIAATGGFLVINWPKARVFMGDGGSGFLGLILGVLMLTQTLVPVWSWLILLGWFIADACLTISLRLISGEKLHEAHSQHAYQHLNRSLGTAKTLGVIHAVNIGWLLPIAVYTSTRPEFGVFLLPLALIPLLAGLYYLGAGQIKPKHMA